MGKEGASGSLPRHRDKAYTAPATALEQTSLVVGVKKMAPAAYGSAFSSVLRGNAPAAESRKRASLQLRERL